MDKQVETELTQEEIKNASIKIGEALNEDPVALGLLETIDGYATDMVDKHIEFVNRMDDVVSALDVPTWDAVRTIVGMMDSYFDGIKFAILNEMANDSRWSESVADYKTSILIEQMMNVLKNADASASVVDNQEEVVPPKHKLH